MMIILPFLLFQVGRVDMSLCEVSRNIIKVCKYISKHFPGGWKNIRSLNIKGLRSISVPIYMSLSEYLLKVLIFGLLL